MKSINSIKLTLSIIVLTAIFSQSCRKGSMWGIEGKGPATEYQNRDVTGFNAIDLSIDANIEYVQDSIYQVTVTGQNNILAILETKVEGKELKMSYRRNVWRHDGLRFVIHSPEMISINISGSGDIDVKNHINGTNLALKISGSGNINVPTVAIQNLNVKISGSGNINMNGGTCKDEDLSISGSGVINTELLKAVTAEVKLSGSGDIIVNASDKLDASISGSGTIKYKGRPAITNSISGSGKLVHID